MSTYMDKLSKLKLLNNPYIDLVTNIQIHTELLNNPNLKLIDDYKNFNWNRNGIYVNYRTFKNGRIDQHFTEIIEISQIKSYKIRKYYIKKYFSECLKNDCNIKLSDFNINKIEFNKENKTIILNNITVEIENIKSEEIRNYYTKEIHDDKDKEIERLKLEIIEKNKEIERLKLEKEELRKFYLDS